MSEENKIKKMEAEIAAYQEKNKILEEVLDEKEKKQSEQDTKTSIYHGVRFIEVICIGISVFGMLWKGTEVLNLDTPGFMMLYGGAGALISEVIARVFKKKILK